MIPRNYVQPGVFSRKAHGRARRIRVFRAARKEDRMACCPTVFHRSPRLRARSLAHPRIDPEFAVVKSGQDRKRTAAVRRLPRARFHGGGGEVSILRSSSAAPDFPRSANRKESLNPPEFNQPSGTLFSATRFTFGFLCRVTGNERNRCANKRRGN